MAEAGHSSNKLHFQLDRISFFTDGVFAIAITRSAFLLMISAINLNSCNVTVDLI